MSVKDPMLEVGYDKNGEMDFGVCATVGRLSYKQMKEFREMIVVSIGCVEDMWKRNREQDIAKESKNEFTT